MATRRPFEFGITFSFARGLEPAQPETYHVARPRAKTEAPHTDGQLSQATRTAALDSLARDPVDLLVIGGGITGAAVARDAALRGIRTALVDKGDFAGATSSHSPRLIHGGLRYLEHADFGLVFEASRERRTLLRIAPHLVRPLPFLFPAYRGARVPAWQIHAALWLYDALSVFRNVHAHRWFGRRHTLREEPNLRERGLRGAGLYYDAQTDDARLAIATIRSAAQAGALVANYATATALLKPDGRVRGATVRDELSGRTLHAQALTVVNAAGPWVDDIRGRDEKGAAPLLKLSKGVHVIVPRARIGNAHAVTLLSPLDGRVMFVLPWGDLSYIGTTETEDPVSPDAVRATGDDVVYLLRSANWFFPQAHLAPKDVIATWAGLRPLLAPPRDVAATAVSREHRVVESANGLITIAGGKLTTHRVMGRDVADRVAARLADLDGRPRAPRPATDRLPLPGGETADLEVLVDAARARGVSEATARHLVGAYGSESAAVLNLVDRDRALAAPIVGGRPEIWAEVTQAVERELAVRLTDVLIRRTHLFYDDPGRATSIAAAVARRMRELLGWDAAREEVEVGGYLSEVKRSRAFLKEVPRASRVIE